MPALREIFAEYDIAFDRRRNLQRGDRAVSRLRGVLSRLTPTVTRVTAALTGMATAAGVGAVAGLQRIVSSTIESTREIERWSNRLQISSGALRSWIELGREYGANVDDITDALKELQLKAQDAISGGTAQAEMFQRIGISLNDLRPVVNDVDALMALFTSRLDRVSDAGLRNFTVDELMSDAGTRMLQVFNLGTSEIQRRRSAITHSIGPTEGLTRAISHHTRRVLAMARRWERFQREITARVLPVVDDLLQKVTEFQEPLRRIGQDILRVARETNLLKGAFVGVGVVAVAVAAATITAWGPVAAVFVGLIASVAGVAAAYDQVTRTIDGSDTALRRFLDSHEILGEGGTAGLVMALGDAWDRIPGILDEAANGARLLANDFENVMTQLGPISEILQTILDIIMFMPRRSILGRLFTGIRGGAQGRALEGRVKAKARTRSRNERLSEREDIDRWTDRPVDAAGRPMSVDLQALDVEELDEGPRQPPPRMNVADYAMTPRQQLLMTPRTPRQQQQNVSVDAPTTMTFNIAEATDAHEVTRLVTRGVETSLGGWVSEITSMFSDPTEAGS